MDCQATWSVAVTQCDPTVDTCLLFGTLPQTNPIDCPAKRLRPDQRQDLALQVLAGEKRDHPENSVPSGRKMGGSFCCKWTIRLSRSQYREKRARNASASPPAARLIRSAVSFESSVMAPLIPS